MDIFKWVWHFEMLLLLELVKEMKTQILFPGTMNCNSVDILKSI